MGKDVEKIGEVTIKYDFYSGQDEYSDGDIENDLLELISSESDVNKIIANDKRWPVLYHFSPVRENILEWYDFKKDCSILEVGSGCGAITGVLCRKARNVTCVDLSKQRSLINANRNKEYDNLTIYVGNFNNFKTRKKFDYITLIGVLEYADYYTDSIDSYRVFLSNIKKYLKDDGHLLIAIENRFGLKYWAGYAEDHNGMYFEGLEGYQNTESKARTFGRKNLERIIKESGYSSTEFYYPLPDYKFPTQIFSDSSLPKVSDVNFGQPSYDKDRLRLFDENKVCEGIIEEGVFPFFANSFFVDASI